MNNKYVVIRNQGMNDDEIAKEEVPYLVAFMLLRRHGREKETEAMLLNPPGSIFALNGGFLVIVGGDSFVED